MMEPGELAELWEKYHAAIQNAIEDPYRYGWVLPHWKYADEMFCEFRTLLLLGANRCLAGEQEIYDPIANVRKRVDSIDEDFHVYAWDADKQQVVIARAEKPFRKPVQKLYRVSLTNGQTLSCSGEHLVLTPFGWKAVASLKRGSLVHAPEGMPLESLRLGFSQDQEVSISDTDQQASPQDAEHWSQRVQDFQFDCPSYPRSYDAQPHSLSDNGQCASPSQGDALQYSSPYGSISRQTSAYELRLHGGIRDARGNRHEHILCALPDPLSTLDALRQTEDRAAGILGQVCGRVWLSVFSKYENQQKQQGHLQSFDESLQKQADEQFPQRDSEYDYALPYRANSISYVFVVNIELLREDVVWDFTVPGIWNYISAGVTSHNSGKTSYGAKSVMKAAMENPDSLIFCFSQNQETSILVQQKEVYNYLPAELKKKAMDEVCYISYTLQNGFSNNSLILPNRSRIVFKTYSQYQQNQTILEGVELGSRSPSWHNIGCWCDEYLQGMEMLDRLYLRLATRNAKLLLTFTPKDGITETVKYYLDGAKTIETRPAELLNNRPVPYTQKNHKKNTGIIYFHSKDNPWSGYEAIAEQCRAKNDESYTLTAAYGVPTKSYASLFPCFSPEVNVVSPDKIPTDRVTRYMVLDPAGRKNWFMVWIAVDPTDTWWVYREWPTVMIGDWAKEYNGKWTAGEGAKGLGYGYKEYVNLIKSLEGHEEIFLRLIDPRFGMAKVIKETGASSMIEELDDHGMTFIPAPGLVEDDGLQALQNKMAYNKSKPIDAINRPYFYISSECENTIRALQEYTGREGPEEAWKDPIDVLRYAAIDNIRYVDPKAMTPKPRKNAGY